MNALTFQKAGEAEEVLALQDIARPVPGPGEILIRVKASPINPSDRFFIHGTYRFKPAFPQTAGLEGAGVVEATGAGVSVPAGSLVSFDGRGAWAEYAVVPETSVVVLPDTFPLEKAAQFYLNPFTAWCLLEAVRLSPGEWLCVTAATAAVSGIVIQLARSRGIRTIATVRQGGFPAELETLSPDLILEQDQQDFASRVLEATGGAGVKGVLDAVGGETASGLIGCMAPGGHIVVYGMLSPAEVRYHNTQLIYRNLTISGFGIRNALGRQTSEERKTMISTLAREISRPAFYLPVSASYALDEFADALRAEATPGRKGKVILLP
jgi:NADPH:quinone reductase-like Zn-dependent oxidoreductase